MQRSCTFNISWDWPYWQGGGTGDSWGFRRAASYATRTMWRSVPGGCCPGGTPAGGMRVGHGAGKEGVRSGRGSGTAAGNGGGATDCAALGDVVRGSRLLGAGRSGSGDVRGQPLSRQVLASISPAVIRDIRAKTCAGGEVVPGLGLPPGPAAIKQRRGWAH